MGDGSEYYIEGLETEDGAPVKDATGNPFKQVKIWEALNPEDWPQAKRLQTTTDGKTNGSTLTDGEAKQATQAKPRNSKRGQTTTDMETTGGKLVDGEARQV